MNAIKAGVAALALVALGSPAFGQAAGAESPIPAPVQRMMACRAIADPGARLACYDKEAGVISEAVTRRDLVIIDREGVRKTKRTLFGLPLPNLGVFDNSDSEVSQVEGVLAGVGRNADGGYVFALKDGANWSQTDSKPIAIEPEAGDKVTIKRGALGSYILSVGRQPGVKVQRVR